MNHRDKAEIWLETKVPCRADSPGKGGCEGIEACQECNKDINALVVLLAEVEAEALERAAALFNGCCCETYVDRAGKEYPWTCTQCKIRALKEKP